MNWQRAGWARKFFSRLILLFSLLGLALSGAGCSRVTNSNSAPINPPPPSSLTVSNVSSSNITSSSATITWTTSAPAASQVEYGTTASYGQSSPLDSNSVTSHSVTLAGLAASTTYHYRVRSSDASSNQAVSGDFKLTTSAPPPPPVTPTLFFSDLESGPNTGNTDTSLGQVSGQNGAIVTIWGANLASSQGSSEVTCNGAPAARVYSWGNATQLNTANGYARVQMVSFQVSHLAIRGLGQITVTVNGVTSNALPFTVRPGNIYFVSTSGNDANNGSYSAPWRTVLKARDTMAPGDTAYAMNGVSQTTDDGQGWRAAMLLRDGGTAGNPKALVAYPGSTVTIGTISGPDFGIRSTDYSASGGAAPGYWVFSGLTLRGVNDGISFAGGTQWRVVGSDFSCPNGNDASACFETSSATYVKFFGNNVHNVGAAGATALYHGVYFSTDSNHIDMGWNVVAYIRGCRGIQIHSSPLQGGGPSDPTGHNQFDISIHDNLIHDTQCDGIIFATVDPSQGKVEAYNNVIYNAGQGPQNVENSGNWSCIYVAGYTNTGPPGGGTVELYNNTMHNCGTYATPPWGDARNAIENGGHNANLRVHIRNNILYQPAGVPYLTIFTSTGHLCADTDNCGGIYGSNNLFFGDGPAPSNTNITNSLSADPLFVNLSLRDFHLTALSPAAHAGTPTLQATDYDGVPLPQGSGYSIGAHAYITGGLR